MRTVFILGSFLILFNSSGIAQDAPEIQLTSISLQDLEGNPLDLEKFHGKAILLNFWATWCKACLYEIPSIEAAQRKMKEEDIVFLLASDESLTKIKKFKQKHSYNLEFIRLNSSFKEALIKYLPSTLLINRDGEIVDQYVGYKDWSTRPQLNELRRLIEKK